MQKCREFHLTRFSHAFLSGVFMVLTDAQNEHGEKVTVSYEVPQETVVFNQPTSQPQQQQHHQQQQTAVSKSSSENQQISDDTSAESIAVVIETGYVSCHLFWSIFEIDSHTI